MCHRNLCDASAALSTSKSNMGSLRGWLDRKRLVQCIISLWCYVQIWPSSYHCGDDGFPSNMHECSKREDCGDDVYSHKRRREVLTLMPIIDDAHQL